MGGCDLCDLPTPNPPITGAEGSGEYCCRGCRLVAASVDSIEPHETVGELADGGVASIPDDAAHAYFAVDGMHCTTCETFLRRRPIGIDGVYSVEANYGLEAAKISYDPDRFDVHTLSKALSGYGYTFHPRDESGEQDRSDRRRRRTAQRLIVGGFFTMLIMPWYFFYLYPVYVGFDAGILEVGRTTTVGIYFPLVVIAAMTTLVLGYTGYPLLRGAWISVRMRQPNMDLLVSLAALAAYGYSVLALAAGRTHLYFDVTVMVVMVVTVGRYYEAGLRTATTATLSGVTAARADVATRVNETGHETVPIASLSAGDAVRIDPGDRVPLDGRVHGGRAYVDESLLTGEGLPVSKEPGNPVIGGAQVLDGAITVTVGSDATSTADRIATAMWDIQSQSPSVQRFADTLATIFVPAVLVLGVAVVGWRLLTGESVANSLLWGLTILLVSCPCAMGLATPLAIAGGLRDALTAGIVVTNVTVFDVIPDVDRLIFDKTGTLTRGEMTVTEVIGESNVLEMAAAVERYAEHPIADAIVDAHERGTLGVTDGGISPTSTGLTSPAVDASTFRTIPGAGVAATVTGEDVVVGSAALIRDRFGPVPTDLAAAIDRINDTGGLPIVVGWDGTARGVFAIEDADRPEWRSVVDHLDPSEVIVLTGDTSGAVDRFRASSRIDRVFAGLPPDAKAATVTRLGRDRTTVMVGDGTNDAPALAAADLGIALSAGTAAAADAADVVVVGDDLRGLESIAALAIGTRRRIRENVGWALLYNAIAIPLAVAGLINPFFAAVAMATSSIIVVTNSRRSVVRSRDSDEP